MRARSVVNWTMPQYSLSKPARAVSSSGPRAARIWRTAIRVLVVFSSWFMLPLASTSSSTRARRSRAVVKWARVWALPSSKIRTSLAFKSRTGRPLPSTTVAASSTRSARAGMLRTWAVAPGARRKAASTTERDGGRHTLGLSKAVIVRTPDGVFIV